MEPLTKPERVAIPESKTNRIDNSKMDSNANRKQKKRVGRIDNSTIDSDDAKWKKRVGDISKVAIFDVGSRDAGGRVFKKDPTTDLISELTTKDTINRTDNLEEKLKQQKYEGMQCIINMTSIFRSTIDPKKHPENVNFCAKACELEIHARGGIRTNILSQEEEQKLVQLAVTYYIKHKDPSNQELTNISPKNIMSDDSGSGSQQSYLCPKQTVEFSGQWAENQVTDGKTLEEVREAAKQKIEPDLIAKVPKKRNVLGVVGLSALVLEDAKVVEALQIPDSKEWTTGRIVKPLAEVISALQTATQAYDQRMTALFNETLRIPAVKQLLDSRKDKAEEKESDKSSNNRKKLISLLTSKKDLNNFEKASGVSLAEVSGVYTHFARKGAPLALTLARYQAYWDKYKIDWKVICMNSNVKLYNPVTKQMDTEMKPNVSAGAAIQYLNGTDKDLTFFGKIKNMSAGAASQ